MKVINFAIIGFGSIARTHALAVYDANLRYDLPFKLNLTHIVTRKPIDSPLPGVNNVTDINQVLCDPNIHFIDICTPNDSHFNIAKSAMDYNKHIYCEKPIASKLEDAIEMTKMANEKGILNSVALIYRTMPSIRLLKQEIQEHTIGDIIDFKIKTYHKSYLSEKKKGTWRTLKNSGGGALLDLGVHLMDIIQFTLGDIQEVEPKTRIFFKDRSQVDEIANCDLTLDGGVKGNLEVSRVFAERNQTSYYVVYGTKGSLKIDLNNPYEVEIYNYKNDSTQIKSVSKGDEFMKFYADKRGSLGFFQNCHTASLVNFANKICGEDNNVGADFNEALKCQKIIDKIYGH